MTVYFINEILVWYLGLRKVVAFKTELILNAVKVQLNFHRS